MKIPEMNRQTRENTIERLKKLGEIYLPEWRFDDENPDIGTALILIYSGIYEDTLKKFNELPKKNMLEFFKYAKASLLGMEPARGYGVFGLVNGEAEGVKVKRRTKLMADREDKEGTPVIFETVNDVYVSPALLLDMFLVHPGEDGIYHMYHYEGQQDSLNFRLFQPKGANLQKHELSLCHDRIFYMEKACCVKLCFKMPRGKSLEEPVKAALADPEKIVYEYRTEDGYEPFSAAALENGMVCLYKGENQPPSMKALAGGIESFWIRMRVFDINPFSSLYVEGLELDNQGNDIEPDYIFAGGTEQKEREYLPFGERMGEYEEVYFGSEQALCQGGAGIRLSFAMNFVCIPADSLGKQDGAEWKLIMKRSDFTPDPEYDIGIHHVIWEYFNGSGWRRLPESSRYEKVFTPDKDKPDRKIEINFSCPTDMESILIYSGVSRFIRARIVKMSNAYKLNGRYITPVIAGARFSYGYEGCMKSPRAVAAWGSLKQQIYRERDLEHNGGFYLFEKIEEKTDTLYIGFDKPFLEGPARLFVQLKEDCDRQGEQVLFEYYGGGRWKSMNVVDGTGGFCKTGILTILGNPDAQPKEMWGKKRYWLRILKKEEKDSGFTWPVILHMYLNATEILGIDTKEPELFFIEPNRKNAEFHLTGGNIYDMEVWVKEAHDLSEQELSKLEKKYPVQIKAHENGAKRQVWVKWKEVPSFAASGPLDYHYMADKNEGRFWFSDGIHGKIPDSGDTDTIYVYYQCAGGSEGNLPKGAVNQLSTSIGYMNQVSNPVITAGGADRENVEQAIARTGKRFYHRERAVSAKDYEAIVMESVRSILKVKCYPHCGEDGDKCPGHIVLVVLLENHYKGRNFFQGVKKEITAYLTGKAPDHLIKTGRLHIVEPVFLTLSVHARVLVKDINEIFGVRQEILEYLEHFLDPAEGNFYGQGWEIGELPNAVELLNALQGIAGVVAVSRLQIGASVSVNSEKKDIDIQSMEQYLFAVPVNGRHEIEIGIGGM